MLPFLKPKKISSIIIARRGKDTASEMSNETEAPSSKVHEGLKSAAEDVINAIESKSAIDLASALQSFFEMCGEMPAEEDAAPESSEE